MPVASARLAEAFDIPQRALIGIEELLQNAIEHGLLGLRSGDKAELLRTGRWEEELERQLSLPENENKQIAVWAWREGNEVVVTIRDPGHGFDWRSVLEADNTAAAHAEPCGRGIALAAAMTFSKLTYRDPGNEVEGRIAVSTPDAQRSIGPKPLTDGTYAAVSSELDDILQGYPVVEALQRVLGYLMTRLGAPSGLLATLDREERSGFAVLAALPGTFVDRWELAAIDLGHARAIVCCNDDFDRAEPCQHTLEVPIAFRGEVVGFLQLAGKARFDAAEAAIAELVARRIAPAVSGHTKLVVYDREVRAYERVIRALRDSNHDNHRDRMAASDMLRKLRKDEALDSAGVSCSISSLGLFSGDLVLMARTPLGELRGFLGDFTGHGLTAGIGSIPITSAFHATTRKAVELKETIATLNDLLKPLLPTEVFCAAIFFALSIDGRTLTVWNGGMPPLYVRSSSLRPLTRVDSTDLPLGIVDSRDLQLMLTALTIAPQDEIVAFTDGVPEQSAGSGELFGLGRVERALLEVEPGRCFKQLLNALRVFSGRTDSDDDRAVLSVRVAEASAWRLARRASSHRV